MKKSGGVAARRPIAKHLADLGLLTKDESGHRQLQVYMARWKEFVPTSRGWVKLDEDAANQTEEGAAEKETATSES